MRKFILDRHEDETGVSGVGIVAEGVEFVDGRAVLRWITSGPNSIGIYDSIADIEAVHGHNGKTQVRWVD